VGLVGVVVRPLTQREELRVRRGIPRELAADEDAGEAWRGERLDAGGDAVEQGSESGDAVPAPVARFGLDRDLAARRHVVLREARTDGVAPDRELEADEGRGRRRRRADRGALGLDDSDQLPEERRGRDGLTSRRAANLESGELL